MTRYTSRPLPPYRHRPGETPHPERDPEGHMHGSSLPPAAPLTAMDWKTNEDYLYGVDLFNAGYYWEAHTFWERLWAAEGTEPRVRDFLQGLVQIAAACLKRVQERSTGARKLLERARASFRRAGTGSGLARSDFGIDRNRIEDDVERFVSVAPPAPPPSIELHSS